ncbi:hypothetical protein F5X97DRAFT_316085 [Nemania serpens]|nr:hypothetical protein F5X97DRAFT_316085 [Nemania serpens]
MGRARLVLLYTMQIHVVFQNPLTVSLDPACLLQCLHLTSSAIVARGVIAVQVGTPPPVEGIQRVLLQGMSLWP